MFPFRGQWGIYIYGELRAVHHQTGHEDSENKALNLELEIGAEEVNIAVLDISAGI